MRRPSDGVRAFLVLTFALTWLPFLPALFGGPAVPLLMPVAPAVASVVVRRWVTHEGFADLGLRRNPRDIWPWLLVALGWPLLAMPLAIAAARVVGVETPGLARLDLASLALWAGAAVLATPLLLGEELGWRGYLQPRVFVGRPVAAAAVTGALWALWHVPLWLVVLDLPLWVLPLATVSLVVTSLFFGWLQERTGSVWAPTVGHSTNNVVEANVGTKVFTGGSDGDWLPLGPSLVIVAAEAVVLVVMVFGSRSRHGLRPRPGRGAGQPSS